MTGFIEKGEGGLLPRDREKGKPFTDGERHELTCLQTKESQRFPAATSISERDIENTLKGNQPCQHLDFRLLVLLELWENIFLIFLSHQSCDNWFGHPEKIDPTTMRSIIGRTGLYTNLTVTEWWSWGLKRKRKKKNTIVFFNPQWWGVFIFGKNVNFSYFDWKSPLWGERASEKQVPRMYSAS